MSKAATGKGGAVLATRALSFPWQTKDPFLFVAYHDDVYPPGDENMGPRGLSWRGRNKGADFGGAWNMYHGEAVPGFPRHPHRGFETVTIVSHGTVDHCDGLGNCGRFSDGDVQWMTAGSGITHGEMFPLLDTERPNRMELFQIWLNLPAKSKMVPPFYKMLWSDGVPKHELPRAKTAQSGGGGIAAEAAAAEGAGKDGDEDGDEPAAVTITTVAGALEEERKAKEEAGAVPCACPAPPPDSWAADPSNGVAIWRIQLPAGTAYTLPPAASPEWTRTLYFYKGESVEVAGTVQRSHAMLELQPCAAVEIKAAAAHDGPKTAAGAGAQAQAGCECMLLQGRPIGEAVVQHGPFVATSREGIVQAFRDYQRTEFEGPGGWPHLTRGEEDHAKVHPREAPRFSRSADGVEDRPR